MSRGRIFSLFFPVGCFCFAVLLGLPGAASAPDAGYYRLVALGQRGAVPAPFSGRILGPAIAGWLGRVTGLGADSGFLLLGVAGLIALLALIAGLLWSWRAPAVIFAGIFLMPFWVDIFHDYYLPDLLHAAILAGILVCLFFGQTGLALLLLFPAYLARESTLLVAFCLVFAGWRRIRLRTALIGILAVVCAGLINRHFGQSGSGSVHGMSGGDYIAGKLLWSFFKNVLGLPLWSNTLPECKPIWVARLPGGHHFGAIRSIGVCPPSVWGPARTLLAWFGIFGIGPALAAGVWRRMVSRGALSTDQLTPSMVIVFRFCIVYGVISIVMAPLLGASADRLVAYGWPFYFVVLPWFLFARSGLRELPAGWILFIHLLTCWLAWFGFRQQTTPGFLLAGLMVMGLNGLGYVLFRRFSAVSSGAGLG